VEEVAVVQLDQELAHVLKQGGGGGGGGRRTTTRKRRWGSRGGGDDPRRIEISITDSGRGSSSSSTSSSTSSSRSSSSRSSSSSSSSDGKGTTSSPPTIASPLFPLQRVGQVIPYYTLRRLIYTSCQNKTKKVEFPKTKEQLEKEEVAQYKLKRMFRSKWAMGQYWWVVVIRRDCDKEWL